MGTSIGSDQDQILLVSSDTSDDSDGDEDDIVIISDNIPKKKIKDDDDVIFVRRERSKSKGALENKDHNGNRLKKANNACKDSTNPPQSSKAAITTDGSAVVQKAGSDPCSTVSTTDESHLPTLDQSINTQQSADTEVCSVKTTVDLTNSSQCVIGSNINVADLFYLDCYPSLDSALPVSSSSAPLTSSASSSSSSSLSSAAAGSSSSSHGTSSGSIDCGSDNHTINNSLSSDPILRTDSVSIDPYLPSYLGGSDTWGAFDIPLSAGSLQAIPGSDDKHVSKSHSSLTSVSTSSVNSSLSALSFQPLRLPTQISPSSSSSLTSDQLIQTQNLKRQFSACGQQEDDQIFQHGVIKRSISNVDVSTTNNLTRNLDMVSAVAGCSTESDFIYSCLRCPIVLPEKNLSFCMNGHPCCPDCLQKHVKELLTNAHKNSVQCVTPNCASFYLVSQLQKTLPPMVVDILEEKFQQEYLHSAIYQGNLDTTSAGTSGRPADDGGFNAHTNTTSGTESGSFKHTTVKNTALADCLSLPDCWQDTDYNELNGCAIFDVAGGTDEYITISQLFYKTMPFPEFEIMNIQRIQNRNLWMFYSLKKQQMIQENGGIDIDEKRLFHGTKISLVDTISKNNFDWRVCGRNGTLYGQGSYFAKEARFSHKYTDVPKRNSQKVHKTVHSIQYGQTTYTIPTLSTPSSASLSSFPFNFSSPAVQQYGVVPVSSAQSLWTCQSTAPSISHSSNTPTALNNVNAAVPSTPVLVYPSLGGALRTMYNSAIPQTNISAVGTDQSAEQSLHTMFVGKVLVGTYTRGFSKLRKPPPLDERDALGKAFDSCVDNLLDPQIYVIFDKSQCYPEYVLKYKSNNWK